MNTTELHTTGFLSLPGLETHTDTVPVATYPLAGRMVLKSSLGLLKQMPGETLRCYRVNPLSQYSVLLSNALALCSSLTLPIAFAADFINITPPAPGGGTYVQTVYVNGSTVYAPTDNGLAISTDGGYTYTNRTAANGLGGGTIAGIYVSGSTVYAATGGGLSISTDGGTTFTTRTNANSGLAGDWLFDVYVDGTTIYTAGNGWLSFSTNGGNTFTNKSNANSGLGIVGSAIYGVYARGSDVYAATNGGGVSISHDGGTTFTNRIVANSGLGHDVVLEVYVDGSTLYAATNGGGLSISTDGGNTFNNRTNANSGLSTDTVNGVYAIGSKVCVATNGGGLAISTDGGTSFVNKYSVDGIGDGIVKDCYFSGLATYAATNNGVSFTPPLAPPTNLTATAVSQTQINLAWTDNSSNETGFKIEQPAGAVINTTAVNATSYSHTGLTCGTTYNYTVKATNAYYGDSTGVTASATTAACPVLPPPVTLLPVTPSIPSPPPLPNYLGLFLQLDGTGTGKVTNDTGLSCQSSDCQRALDGTLTCAPKACTQAVKTYSTVTLTPQADVGSTFSSWGGHPDCVTGQFIMDSGKLCIAFFHLLDEPLTVTVQGQGHVTDTNLHCSEQCVVNYLYGTAVTLLASPATGWQFQAFSGDCNSTGQVLMTSPKTCGATFIPDPATVDNDLDHITSVVEDAAPNHGDGNGDGIPDSQQNNVASFVDLVSEKYLTLQVDKTCPITNVYSDFPEHYAGTDPNHKFLQGVTYFELSCAKTQVTVYYHRVSKLYRNLKFYKFGPTVPGDMKTVGWYKYPATFVVVQIDGQPVLTATYTLTDGQLGDSTGVDGKIVDPGGIELE